jgi:hypothetical protein
MGLLGLAVLGLACLAVAHAAKVSKGQLERENPANPQHSLGSGPAQAPPGSPHFPEVQYSTCNYI